MGGISVPSKRQIRRNVPDNFEERSKGSHNAVTRKPSNWSVFVHSFEHQDLFASKTLLQDNDAGFNLESRLDVGVKFTKSNNNCITNNCTDTNTCSVLDAHSSQFVVPKIQLLVRSPVHSRQSNYRIFQNAGFRISNSSGANHQENEACNEDAYKMYENRSSHPLTVNSSEYQDDARKKGEKEATVVTEKFITHCEDGLLAENNSEPANRFSTKESTFPLPESSTDRVTFSPDSCRKLKVRGLKKFVLSRKPCPPLWAKQFPCRSKFHPDTFLEGLPRKSTSGRSEFGQKRITKRGGRCHKCGIYVDNICSACTKCKVDCTCQDMTPQVFKPSPEHFLSQLLPSSMNHFTVPESSPTEEVKHKERGKARTNLHAASSNNPLILPEHNKMDESKTNPWEVPYDFASYARSTVNPAHLYQMYSPYPYAPICYPSWSGVMSPFSPVHAQAPPPPHLYFSYPPHYPSAPAFNY